MYSDNIKGKISKIKKLKLDNYLNNYFIHKTFYSVYKSPKAKRITSSPNKIKNNENKICLSLLRTQNAKIFKTKSKSTNRLIGFNTNYKLYDYVKKGDVLGTSNKNLYLVFKKDGKVLNYEKYL